MQLVNSRDLVQLLVVVKEVLEDKVVNSRTKEEMVWTNKMVTTIIRMVDKVTPTIGQTSRVPIVTISKTWMRWVSNRTFFQTSATTQWTVLAKLTLLILLKFLPKWYRMEFDLSPTWCHKYQWWSTRHKARLLLQPILSTLTCNTQRFTSMKSSSSSCLRSLKTQRTRTKRILLATSFTSMLKSLLVQRKLQRSLVCSSICQMLSWTTPFPNGSTSSRKWCLPFTWSPSQIQAKELLLKLARLWNKLEFIKAAKMDSEEPFIIK